MARHRHRRPPHVRIRPGRGSCPRIKQRPAHADAAIGTVTRIDRGHYRIRLADPAPTRDGTGDITAMKARELGRGKVVVGDRVAVVGDTSGRTGTLARMVRIEERATLDGVFKCKHPHQYLKIILSSSVTLLDDGIFPMTKEEKMEIFSSIVDLLEQVLGVEEDVIMSKLKDSQ